MPIDHDIQDDADQPQDRLLADLARLAQAIDARRFPGRAWPVRRRNVLRVWWPPAMTAMAAAAAILLAVLLAWQSDSRGPVRTTFPPSVAQVQDHGEDDWDLPAGITPELADMAQPNLVGQLELSIPNVSMPPLGGGTFTWSVPQMELTPKIDIEPDVPADNGQTQSSQRKDERA